MSRGGRGKRAGVWAGIQEAPRKLLVGTVGFTDEWVWQHDYQDSFLAWKREITAA